MLAAEIAQLRTLLSVKSYRCFQTSKTGPGPTNKEDDSKCWPAARGSTRHAQVDNHLQHIDINYGIIYIAPAVSSQQCPIQVEQHPNQAEQRPRQVEQAANLEPQVETQTLPV